MRIVCSCRRGTCGKKERKENGARNALNECAKRAENRDKCRPEGESFAMALPKRFVI
jgi:hypothetical protein